MRTSCKALVIMMFVVAALMSACGMDTNTIWGAHDNTVVTKYAQNVVSGSVYCPGWTITSVTVCGATTTGVGIDGTFVVENVNCGLYSVPYATAVVSQSSISKQLMYYLQSPANILATADIVIKSPYDWYGQTGTTYYVPGNGNAIRITGLTDAAYNLADNSVYKVIHSRNRFSSADYTNATTQLNTYLNNQFSTSGVDYVVNPSPSDEVVSAANVFANL